ncbi:MAG: hypothetical protein SCARUB_03740 [Candidatus Scalindua rubra]|uniref:Uncharacterized protein n=1 Tax=Candidatus Scalindua rubra TaxID=1872076 RepID=A0A1E3X6D3_9BACT|nr:MAG: hypothetical protein SCARUB_03740 [Candidatus Scalindua rubra]
MKTTRDSAKRAKKHLDKIYQLTSQVKSPFEGLSEEEIIKKLRKTREEVWEEKLASSP